MPSSVPASPRRHCFLNTQRRTVEDYEDEEKPQGLTHLERQALVERRAEQEAVDEQDLLVAEPFGQFERADLADACELATPEIGSSGPPIAVAVTRRITASAAL